MGVEQNMLGPVPIAGAVPLGDKEPPLGSQQNPIFTVDPLNKMGLEAVMEIQEEGVATTSNVGIFISAHLLLISNKDPNVTFEDCVRRALHHSHVMGSVFSARAAEAEAADNAAKAPGEAVPEVIQPSAV